MIIRKDCRRGDGKMVNNIIGDATIKHNLNELDDNHNIQNQIMSDCSHFKRKKMTSRLAIILNQSLFTLNVHCFNNLNRDIEARFQQHSPLDRREMHSLISCLPIRN